MYKLKIAALLSSLLISFASNAAEEIAVDFTYDRNVNIGSIRAVLKLENFSDDRGLENPNQLTEQYTVDAPLADIVRDAFAQGFAKGKVELVDSGDTMQVRGNIISSEAEIVDRSGVQSIQLTIRAGIQLTNGGRTIWENNLFGRGIVPESEGMSAAINASLERMVRELFMDDYFLIELQ